MSTQSSSDATISRRCEASINGLLCRFVLMDRKEKRPSRITSVVFNQHGTEILSSYSSESLYLLDPKHNISQEQSQIRLKQHQEEKQSRLNSKDHRASSSSTISAGVTTAAAAAAQEKKTSQFKRLRLRGDWSDTGLGIH